jgi:hypothetical protein
MMLAYIDVDEPFEIAVGQDEPRYEKSLASAMRSGRGILGGRILLAMRRKNNLAGAGLGRLRPATG